MAWASRTRIPDRAGEALLAGALAILLGLLFAASAFGQAALKADERCDPRNAAEQGVDVPELRTATKQVFRNPCGGLVAKVASQADSFKDRNGRWQRIDNTLVADGAQYRNKAGEVAVTVPRDIAGWTRISRGGHMIEFALEAAKGTGSVRGGRASFANALPGASVLYDVMSTGVKEDILIEDQSSPASFTYRLRVSKGLEPDLRGGGITFRDADGEEIAAMPAPFMHDVTQTKVLTTSRYGLSATIGTGRSRSPRTPDSSIVTSPLGL